MIRQALTVLAVACVGCAQSVPPKAALVMATQIGSTTTILIDGHNDLFVHFMDCETCPRGFDEYNLRDRVTGDTDIPRLRAGGVGALLLNVFPRTHSTKNTLAAFDFLRQLEARYGDTFEVAGTAADVRRIHGSGRIALVPTMEMAFRLENSPMMVRTLHRLGLRAVTLAYSTSDLADGSNDAPRHGGLSELGRTIVREMNRTGVLVDISHVSAQAMHDVLDIAAAPVIFSHSSARALVDVPRNVPDDVLRRLPANGGIVMVSFVPYFSSQAHAHWVASREALSEDNWTSVKAGTLSEVAADERWERWLEENPEPSVSIGEVADHVEHIRRVAGIDHVGLGSDFDGMPHKVVGLEDVSTFPRLLDGLRNRGWSDEELAKLKGENFLRVMERAESVARVAQGNQ